VLCFRFLLHPRAVHCIMRRVLCFRFLLHPRAVHCIMRRVLCASRSRSTRALAPRLLLLLSCSMVACGNTLSGANKALIDPKAVIDV
jgi:hypothetical protein